MESLRSYILSVVTAAIFCALVLDIAGKKSSAAPILKLLSGLFLALTVIRPIAQVHVEEFLHFTEDLDLEAAAAAEVGSIYYQVSLAQVIQEQTRTYIMDKAQTLNASVTAEVVLDEQAIPKEVTIHGQISPYAKAQLTDYIASDLGIPKERQTWIVSSSG